MGRDPQDTHRPLLLLVDDAPANLQVLATALRDDYRIKTALSGEVALELANKSDTPDIVLLDVMMPGMNGHVVLAHLRDNPHTRDIPVILVTADSTLSGELRGLELGADDWLSKPVSIPVLRARVMNLLRRRRAEQQLAQRELRLRTLLESMTDVVAVFSKDYVFTDFHWPAVLEFPHRSAEEMIGLSVWQFLGPQYRCQVESLIERIVQERCPVTFSFSQELKGSLRHFEATISLLGAGASTSEEAETFLAVLRDVSARVAQLEQQRLLVTALEATDNGIVITDRNAFIQWANPAFSRLTGFSAAEAIGHRPGELIRSGLQPQEFYQNLWETILGGQVWRGELVNKRKSGELYHEELTITPLRSGQGEITHFIAVKQDVSSRKSMERELVRLASTDPLTGVANRRQLLERMQAELVRLKRYGSAVSFLMLDLDFFKKVNDRFGHAVGDQVLCHISGVAQSELRKSDLFGRMGGEEFGILLPETDIERAVELAERLRERVAREPLSATDELIRVTLSIGVSEFTWLDTGTETVLARADAALYRAKQAGRNRVEREKRRSSG